jgi:hypothetical protein
MGPKQEVVAVYTIDREGIDNDGDPVECSMGMF